MAVRLLLDNHEVITDSSQEIRITKENPYFTLSDSYTLEVSVPLYILQNRRFFGNIHRRDRRKEYREYACRLYCSNKLLLEGTAHILQSSESVVKLQLATGISALKMSSEQEGTYIDAMITEIEGANYYLFSSELDDGYRVGPNHSGYGIPLYDSSNDKVVNIREERSTVGRVSRYASECPKLLDVARLVAAKMGYTLNTSVLPIACESIYIVSATHGHLGKKLPHWTVKEFFTQLQNFFGCTLVRDGSKALRMVSVNSFVNNGITSIRPLDEYQAEYSEDDDVDGIMNKNVEFDMDESGLETVDEEILAQAEYTASYDSAGAMQNAFRNDGEYVKMHKIYRLTGEKYVGWKTEEGQYDLKRIAPFNPLKRFDGAGFEQLKIVPAHIEEDVDCLVSSEIFKPINMPYTHFTLHLPSVTNAYEQTMTTDFDSEGDTQKPTLQSLVEGTESVDKDEEKADVMCVVFFDNRREELTIEDRLGLSWTYSIHLGFTDYNFQRQLSNNRSRWSFSLNELAGYDFYLGQLHQLSFSCSHKVKHLFKFLSDSIPNPEDIFVIDGKRYVCEKIEANVRDGELDKLMTGYFHEMFTDSQ